MKVALLLIFWLSFYANKHFLVMKNITRTMSCICWDQIPQPDLEKAPDQCIEIIKRKKIIDTQKKKKIRELAWFGWPSLIYATGKPWDTFTMEKRLQQEIKLSLFLSYISHNNKSKALHRTKKPKPFLDINISDYILLCVTPCLK